MAVLSVDLACKRYRDIGVVALQEVGDHVTCELIDLPLTGAPTPVALAEFLHGLCTARDISILLLDGPQGWRTADSAFPHCRQCERAFNTPAKTGLPGVVKPASYTQLVVFSIAVFDALAQRGWARLSSPTGPQIGPILIESFPLAAWRSLGIAPLPAKAKTQPADLADRLARLCTATPVQLSGTPTHDQLQAVVAGLAGLALENGEWDRCAVSGVAPTLVEQHWREGFIVVPRPRENSRRATARNRSRLKWKIVPNTEKASPEEVERVRDLWVNLIAEVIVKEVLKEEQAKQAARSQDIVHPS